MNESGSKRLRADGERGCVEALENGVAAVLELDPCGADVGIRDVVHPVSRTGESRLKRQVRTDAHP